MEKDKSNIMRRAGDLIRGGKLVAFPTETVYGLGADAFNAAAVRRIFEVKQRPASDPLIVHIADMEDLGRVSSDLPDEALKLAGLFWPGPLTIILKKSADIPPEVTAGLDTVAVRMPSHPLALELIKNSGTPVAAPSANVFGSLSPTRARHVREELGDKVDYLIDGGSSDIGVESTIVDLTVSPFCLLRPGGVPLEELSSVLGRVEYRFTARGPVRAPGTMASHYSPAAEMVVVEFSPDQVEKMSRLAGSGIREGKKVGVITSPENSGRFPGCITGIYGPDPGSRHLARNLFSLLRDMDRAGVDLIIAGGVEESGMGLAVMDRLRRGSACARKE